MTDLEKLRRSFDGAELSDSDLVMVSHELEKLQQQVLSELAARSLRGDRTFRRRIAKELASLTPEELEAATRQAS